MSVDKPDEQLDDTLNTLSVRNDSLWKEKHLGFGGNESTDTELNEMSINEDDFGFYEALGLKAVVKEMFSESTFNFAALHKIINMLVRNLGATTMWLADHKSSLENLCKEFEDEYDDDHVPIEQLKGQAPVPIQSNFASKTTPIRGLNKQGSIQSEIEEGSETARKFNTNTQDTPRINLGKKSNNQRLIDPTSQTAPMTKNPIEKKPELGRSKMMQKSMGVVKDMVKSELYQDLKNMIDNAVSEHASQINVTQIQKIPENKTESIKEEIGELKVHLSKIASKEETIEKKVLEFERNFPRLNMDMGNVRTEIQTKSSKDELQTINMQIPNFATKQDIDLVFERMKDKTDSQETNDLRINLESLRENQKTYCTNNKFDEKSHEYEEIFKRIFDTKADRTWAMDKFSDVYKTMREKDEEYEEYKNKINTKFEYYNKMMKKLEQSIENKAEKDQIWEIRDIIRDLVNKEQIQELEDKVFPLMKEVVGKIQMFDEKIEDSKRQMMRFDEIVLDKASKYDILSINKKVDKCLYKAEFDLHIEKYEKFSESINERTSLSETELVEQTTQIKKNQDYINNIQGELVLIKEKQQDVITNEDLNEIRERIDTKADKVEIAQIYDIKSNKVDISSLVKSLDYVHKQLEYQSMISVSTLKSLVWNHGSSNEDQIARNRAILLKHATNVCNWINLWTVGDVYKSSRVREVPMELSNFEEFADQTMKDVQGVFDKMKENKLYLGNKGFKRGSVSMNSNQMRNQSMRQSFDGGLSQLPRLK